MLNDLNYGKIILGIDPGYARMGWGVISTLPDRVECLGFGCIETPKDEEMGARLAYLDDALKKIIGNYMPNDIVIEELFFAKNVKTALNVAHARGIVLMRAAKHSGKIFQYRPNVIKLATTGEQKADKKLMQQCVAQILGFKNVPKPDDAADALAVAITHSKAEHGLRPV
jgi:crossover junction endodeoxyribonuclease RuvC